MGAPESISVGILTGSIERAPIEVYNLAVEDDHTFIAGGVIAHNCPRCAALDGQAWTLEGEKLTGTKVEFQAPPIHWNDRCVLSPIPKSESDQGPSIGARASKDGPVPAGTTFQEFLKRQSPEFVEKVLGKQRAALFRAGKITVRDLVSGNGRELSLAELRTA